MENSSSENFERYLERMNATYLEIRRGGYDIFIYKPKQVKNFCRVKMFKLKISKREYNPSGSINLNSHDKKILENMFGKSALKFINSGEADIFPFDPEKRSDEPFNLKDLEEVARGDYVILGILD